MSDPLLVYGANGFTGRLITLEAVRRGLKPVLGGRNAPALAAMAKDLRLLYRVARLDDPNQLDRALDGVRVVLHAAGPFAETAAPMLAACLRNGAHYLDISGELPTYATSVAQDGDARRRQIMIMPGVGFDVVPSDCLAAHLARRLPGADELAIAIKGLVQATRGSARTLASYAGTAPIIRRHGTLVSVPWLERCFDFGDGPERALCISWGDVVAAFYTTGIPNISVFFDTFPLREMVLRLGRSFGDILQLPVWQTWLRTALELFMEAPARREHDATTLVVVAEVADTHGRRAVARLRTPEAYSFTATTAATIAARVLDGDYEIGWQTPGRVFGPDFVLDFPGVQREDVV